MAQRLNKKLVVALTLAGAAAMMVGGVLLIVNLPAKDPGPLLAQAREFEKNGNYDEARTAYARAASAARRVQPDSPHSGKANEYTILAGDMAYKGGRIGEAEGLWSSVLRDDRTNETAQTRILDLYLESYRLVGDAAWTKVEEEARQLCDMKPEHPSPKGQRALGLALIKQPALKPENAGKGEELLKKVLEADKGDAEAVEYLASYYLQDARQILGGSRPQDTYRQADARLVEAQQLYENLVANLPSDAKAAAVAWRYRGQFYLELRGLAWDRLRLLHAGTVVAGSEAEMEGQFADADKKAMESLERAAQGDPADEKCLWGLGTYWASKPSLEKDEAKKKSETEGFQAKAKEQYQRAIDAAPDEFDAYLRLSLLYRQVGNAAAAAKVLEDRLARGVQRGTWLERRSRAGLTTLRGHVFDLRWAQASLAGRDSQERADLAKALERLCAEYATDAEGGEGNAGVKFMRGRLLLLNEKYAEALKVMEEANTVLGGSNPEVKFKLAQLYDMNRAPGRAEELLRELTQSAPGSEGAWVFLATVQLELGKVDEALLSSQRALQLNPGNKAVLQVMYRAYQAKGNTEGMKEIQRQLGIETKAEGKIVEEALVLVQKASSGKTPDTAGLDSAKAKLREALALDPTYYPALRLLALILAPKEGDSAELMAKQTGELKAALDTALAAVEKKVADPTATKPASPGEAAVDYGRLATNIRKLSPYAVPTTSVAERVKILEGIINEEKDPYERATGLASLYVSVGRGADAVEQMKKAIEARPKDTGLVESTFNLALTSKETWPAAEECIAKLLALGAAPAKGGVHRARLALVKAESAGQEANLKEAQAMAAVARKELEESIKEYPDDPDVCALLGQALGMLDQTDAAQQVLSKALKLNPQHRIANLLMYQLAANRRDEGQRQVYLRKLREVWPDRPEVRREDEAVADERDPKAAIVRREKLAKDNPQDLSNLLVLASLYAGTGAADKAKATYEQCRQNEPNNLVVAGRYAAFLREKDPPDATAAEQLLKQLLVSLTDAGEKAKAQLVLAGHYQEMFLKGGPNAPTQQDLTAAYEAAAKLRESPEVLVDIAQFYARAGKLPEAEAKLRRALELSNTGELRELNRRIRQGLIRVLMNLPEDRYGEIESEIKAYGERFSDGFAEWSHSELATATGRTPEALEDISTYITKMPNDAGGFFRRGYIHYQRGAIDEAIDDLRKAEALDPRGLNYQHRRLLAQCLVVKNQSDVAIAQLNAIIHEDPNAGDAVKQLVDLYESQKQWAPAEALVLSRARDLNNRSRLNWLGVLADLYSRQGDMAKAVQAARETVEAGQYQPSLLDTFAGLCVRGNQPREFIDFVGQKVPAEQRQRPSVQLRLAEAHAAAKEMPKALELYEQVLVTANGEFGAALAVASSMNKAAGKEGIDWLQKRLAAKPDDRALRFGLGAVQLQGGDYDGGMKSLGALLAETTGTDDRAKSEKASLLRQMSVAAHSHKSLAEARKLYEQLLEVEPKNFQASNNLAYLLMTEFKDLPKARKLAEEAVQGLTQATPPQDRAVLLDTLGWSLVQAGELDSGIARLQQAAGLAQSGSEAYDYVMAGIYYHAAEGHLRRSQVQGSRNVEFDRGEAVVASRRAWRLLKTGDPTDPDHMREALQALAGKLKVELEEKTPASQPGSAP